MAEINCPMCGNSNPDGAETCADCGARLTPVSGGEAASDWLRDSRDQAEGRQGGSRPQGSSSSAHPEDDEAAGSDSEGLGEGEVPDWLRRVREKQASEEGEQVDEFADLRAGFDFESEAEETDEAEAEGLPSWLQEAEETPAVEQPRSARQPRAEPTEEDQEPPAAEPGSGLPHVSPLIGDRSAGLDADELGHPDWLGEIQPLEDEPERPTPDPGSDLERATLPNWLEAMRPVDTFRSVARIDAEDDQAIESIGPLAGLRGVLLAEPVVAMPRSSATGAMQLEVSERQYAQAELLHRLISEEERGRPAAPKRRIRLAFIRWGIAALTLLAASLPILTGSPGFALPALEPKELGPLFDLVGRLPTDRPTLFVYDYDPGNSGELDAVSGALLDQVMGRGLPVASVSTRPTGSPLAERAMQRYAIRHGYVAGSDLIHLGYLSGGPAAVQLFALNPRGAILKGFALPESMVEAGQGAWDSPVLANVNSLSDFSMVAVITAGSETARVWIEQAEPHMGNTPLLMVLSAGAEPLVRPYYEASQPQIDGILTGLPAAVAYEQRNGRFGSALDHWNSFGAGMLAAELVLIAGAGYGLVRWMLARRAG